jgi:hypothetical protein
MEGCPSAAEKLCFKEKNRWNLLRPEERYDKYVEFWESLGAALPFQEWIDAWISAGLRRGQLKTRATFIKELWRIRCSMEKNLELVNREKFQSLCKRIREHRSGCGKKPRARTCRKSKSPLRNVTVKVVKI